MTRKKGKHLSRENREVIESGVRDGDSARAIANRIDASTSTVTREVKAHRKVAEKKLSPKEKASLRCANRDSCQASGTACPKCSTKLTNCRDCRTRRCVLTSLDMPRKARLLPRRRPDAKGQSRERVDRTGRTYDDFNELPVEDKARVVQGDSVEGYEWNSSDILSLHLVAHAFQVYLKKDAKSSPAPVVALSHV